MLVSPGIDIQVPEIPWTSDRRLIVPLNNKKSPCFFCGPASHLAGSGVVCTGVAPGARVDEAALVYRGTTSCDLVAALTTVAAREPGWIPTLVWYQLLLVFLIASSRLRLGGIVVITSYRCGARLGYPPESTREP